jgi:hypothetical protein
MSRLSGATRSVGQVVHICGTEPWVERSQIQGGLEFAVMLYPRIDVAE